MAISIYVSSAFLSINTSAVLRIYMPGTVVVLVTIAKAVALPLLVIT
jgi:hypothetical protein